MQTSQIANSLSKIPKNQVLSHPEMQTRQTVYYSPYGRKTLANSTTNKHAKLEIKREYMWRRLKENTYGELHLRNNFW